MLRLLSKGVSLCFTFCVVNTADGAVASLVQDYDEAEHPYLSDDPFPDYHNGVRQYAAESGRTYGWKLG